MKQKSFLALFAALVSLGLWAGTALAAPPDPPWSPTGDTCTTANGEPGHWYTHPNAPRHCFKD